jgi:hypothetical protein
MLGFPDDSAAETKPENNGIDTKKDRANRIDKGFMDLVKTSLLPS